MGIGIDGTCALGKAGIVGIEIAGRGGNATLGSVGMAGNGGNAVLGRDEIVVIGGKVAEGLFCKRCLAPRLIQIILLYTHDH